MILFALSISAAVFSLTINPARQETSLKQADSQVSTLQNAITAKQTQLAGCNPSYLTKCVNPRTAELQALQTQLNELLKQSNALSEARASAQFWQKAADYLGTNPNDLQLNFAIARAVVLDLLGLILISQYTAARRLQLEKHPNL
ncbi:hypothetical protein EPO05_06510 [Patescibacteria group bacterium]|nr:MAG: hypothetical protein EPO05_06510 [Patescibacteria group bacterium]